MTAGSGDEGGDARARARAAAARAIERAKSAEPSITLMLEEIARTNGASLARLETRFKDENVLADKILDRLLPPDDAESVARGIADVLRYTAVLADDGYWEAGSRLCAAIVEAGFVHVKASRGWESVGYKGRNERFKTSSEYVFELQIHTSASLAATVETHPIYEEQRRSDNPDRRYQLQQMQDRVFENVPIPEGTPRPPSNLDL